MFLVKSTWLFSVDEPGSLGPCGVHFACLRRWVENLSSLALIAHAAVDHPLVGTHHVVGAALPPGPGVEAVLLAPAGWVADAAGDTVGGPALVGFVLTRIIRLPPDATLDHGEVLASSRVQVEQHGVVTLVEVLLPSGFPCRLTAVVELGAFLGVSLLVRGATGADFLSFRGSSSTSACVVQ